MLAIQEIHWTGDESIKSNNTTIFYSGTQNNKHEKEVGFIVNEMIMPFVKCYVTINEYIC